MSILTILYISFWLTVGYVATRAALELVRTLLLVGLTKLEDRLTDNIDVESFKKERAEKWMVDNAHRFDSIDELEAFAHTVIAKDLH